MSKVIAVSKRLQDHVRALRAAGYQVRAPGKWVLKTFEVDEERDRQFRTLAESGGLKIKEALDMALAEWISKYGMKKSPRGSK